MHYTTHNCKIQPLSLTQFLAFIPSLHILPFTISIREYSGNSSPKKVYNIGRRCLRFCSLFHYFPLQTETTLSPIDRPPSRLPTSREHYSLYFLIIFSLYYTLALTLRIINTWDLVTQGARSDCLSNERV